MILKKFQIFFESAKKAGQKHIFDFNNETLFRERAFWDYLMELC